MITRVKWTHSHIFLFLRMDTVFDEECAGVVFFDQVTFPNDLSIFSTDFRLLNTSLDGSIPFLYHSCCSASALHSPATHSRVSFCFRNHDYVVDH